MDFNTQHSVWSFWQYRVYPDGTKRPDMATVRENCARFGRLTFGSASEMRVVCATDADARVYWEISVRTEGHPAHDPAFTEWMHDRWRTFFLIGFGMKSAVQTHARLEAGDRQDGTPADQLIMLPSITLEGVDHDVS